MLTERIRQFPSALVAFAPVRLSVLNSKKTSAKECGSLFAIVDERLPVSFEQKLKNFGFTVIRLESDIKLSSAISAHTDMLLFKHGSTLIGSAHYFRRHPKLSDEIFRSAKSFDIRLCERDFEGTYPYDAIFNALVINKTLFCKSDTISPTILSYADEKNLKVVKVKQGYPACTTLSIGNSLAVTSDRGMANALSAEGIEVMLVPECENIKLPPYKNGFIGGSAGVFGNKIYFLGNARTLPYYVELSERARKAGYEIISLGGDTDLLLDLGGIIFFDQSFQYN